MPEESVTSTRRRAGATPPEDGRALAGILRHWAEASPDSPCLAFRGLDDERRTWTFAELLDDARRLAAGLVEQGLAPGDRCVIHTGNTPGFMTAFWAVQEAGAVAVPTIAQYAADELSYVVADCGAKLAVVAPELAATAADALHPSGGCRIVVEGSAADAAAVAEGAPATEEMIDRCAPLSPRTPGSDTAVILYTSGTTSRPKGVELGHEGIVFTSRCYADHLRLQRGDTTLTCLPLFHANGLLLQALPAILSGGRLVVTPRFSASRYWDWVDDEEATATHLVAGPIRLLLAREPSAGDQRPWVRLMSFGMPLVDEEIRAAEERFGFPLVMVWGLTETGCGGTLQPLDYLHRPQHQNVGQAMRGWDVGVAQPEADAVDGLLPDETVGELVVRSPGVMLRYHEKPEATAATKQDGWIRTGDLGWRDEDGYFHFVDRLKDMIKPSGENVSAGEVERVLLEHPGVAKCAVIGLPDPIRIEQVCAVVVASGSALDVEDLRSWCAERLAPFKVPTRFEFVDDLPETSIGKARKTELRERFLAAGIDEGRAVARG